MQYVGVQNSEFSGGAAGPLMAAWWPGTSGPPGTRHIVDEIGHRR
jgi:hypothetical protein